MTGFGTAGEIELYCEQKPSGRGLWGLEIFAAGRGELDTVSPPAYRHETVHTIPKTVLTYNTFQRPGKRYILRNVADVTTIYTRSVGEAEGRSTASHPNDTGRLASSCGERRDGAATPTMKTS